MDDVPFTHLILLEILYPDMTVCVIILPTFIAIEQLFFVWAFLILADEEAFIFITDAAILEKRDLGFS